MSKKHKHTDEAINNEKVHSEEMIENEQDMVDTDSLDQVEEVIDVHEKEMFELKKKINMLQDSLLRNQAELQNYKRRKDEEMEKILKYKNEDFIKEMLSVVDNFERAISMDDSDLSDEVSKFLAGFKLIYTNMITILNKFDVKEIDAEGVTFDPDYHHAVLTDHDDSKPAGVVLEVLQKGFLYKDRVIRPAMVKVNN